MVPDCQGRSDPPGAGGLRLVGAGAVPVRLRGAELRPVRQPGAPFEPVGRLMAAPVATLAGHPMPKAGSCNVTEAFRSPVVAQGVRSMRAMPWLMAAIVAWLAAGGAAVPAELHVWPVDPHSKVFRDTLPGDAAGGLQLRAARNEWEPAQFAVRSAKALQGVRVEVSPLRHAEGQTALGPEHVSWNFVGFIPLKKNTPGSEAIRVRAAPCEIPDPLLDARTLDLPADTTQPVWLTVRVPKEAAAGVYRGEVVVMAGSQRAALPIELRVEPWTLPDTRHVLVTNWFNLHNIAAAHGLAVWSEPYWSMLERYAQNMAAHRQNVVLVPWSLIEVTERADGTLAFDYGRFDRFVELFMRCGVGERLEIAHLGGGEKGWGTPFRLSNLQAKDEKTGKRVSLGPEEGMLRLAADLQRHLEERGWLDRSMIHVGDEPILTNLASWRAISGAVHGAAPRLRRIEAIETIDCTGALEVWVPQLIHFDRWREAYEARRAHGEFWFYICCNPYGSVYPNRFLDYPLSRVRVLHWLNFTEDLAGYLHWGLNFWGKEPFGVPSDRLPPGDTHVIYPGKEGPLNSIRWELQRESLEDCEYLHLLVEQLAEVKKRLGKCAEGVRPRRRALELARRVVPAITQTELDPVKIQAVRWQVAEEIGAALQPPLVLIETEPAEGAVLVEGPVAVEVRGVVQAGATVRVNNRPVEVAADGQFVARTGAQIRIEIEHQGKKKEIRRSFTVRR